MASGTGYSSLLYEIYLCPFFCFLTTLLGLVSGSLPVSLGFGSTRQSLSFARLSPLSRNTHPLLDAEVVDDTEDQAQQPLIPCLRFPKTRLWVLITAVDGMPMPMDATGVHTSGVRNCLERCRGRRFDTIGDFLAPFPYIEWHRTHSLNLLGLRYTALGFAAGPFVWRAY